jgi:hypothetical protein
MSALQGNGHVIDSKEASIALSEINDMVQRVRQSRIYDLASQIMIMWGALVCAGNIATFISISQGPYIWIAVNALGVAGTAALSTFDYRRTGVRSFDWRVLATFLLFFAFGLFCSVVLGHFGPREMGTFWPIYFMLFYCIAGLWFGRAFVAIGLGVTVLTLIGYFFITSAAFLLWMAVVNGGGLIVSGLWMRWGA